MFVIFFPVYSLYIFLSLYILPLQSNYAVIRHACDYQELDIPVVKLGLYKISPHPRAGMMIWPASLVISMDDKSVLRLSRLLATPMYDNFMPPFIGGWTAVGGEGAVVQQ